MQYPQRLVQTLIGVCLIGGALASCQSESTSLGSGPVRSDQPWAWLNHSPSDPPIPTPPPPLPSPTAPSAYSPGGDLETTLETKDIPCAPALNQPPIPTPPPPLPSPTPSATPAELVFTPAVPAAAPRISQPPIPTPPPPLPSPAPVPKPPFPIPGQDQVYGSRPFQIALSAFLNSQHHRGILPIRQGVVLLDPQGRSLASHQPTQTFPAASLSQLATSLAALETWGPTHRFETRVYAVGELQDQRLTGHLWVEGGFDPYFTSKDARSLARQLDNLGIEEITGGLRITGPFFMGGQIDSQVSAQILKPHLDLQIQDSGVPSHAYPASGQLLIRHASLPLEEILKITHTYNSQAKADMLASGLGGVRQIESTVRSAAQLSPAQIQLQDGSGLSSHNRLSPLVVAQILQRLQDHTGSLSSILPEVGVEGGALSQRDLPLGTVAVSGSSQGVSVLAGQLPHGLIFVLINQGPDPQVMEDLQARFLRDVMLIADWDH